MVSILFFIKKKKLLKDGTAPIYVRVTVRKMAAEIAVKKSINPLSWIAVKGRTKANNLLHKQINAFLDQQEYFLQDIAMALQKEGKEVSAKEILKRYKGEDESNVSILELYGEHNAQLKSLIGISVAKGTYDRHETSLKLFKEFLLAECKRQDIPVREINASLMEKYMHYLLTVRHTNNIIIAFSFAQTKVMKLFLFIEKTDKKFFLRIFTTFCLLTNNSMIINFENIY